MSLPFIHNPADIIRWLMIDKGIGTDPADGGLWPIYRGSEPDTPDSVITVYGTTGQQDGRSQVSGEVFEHHGYMIRVRSNRESTASEKAYAIDQILNEQVANQLVNIDGYTYIVCAVNRKGSVNSVGKETPTSERNVFTINAISAIYRTS